MSADAETGRAVGRPWSARRRFLAFALGFSSLLLLAHLTVLGGSVTRMARHVYGQVDQRGLLLLILLSFLLAGLAWLPPCRLAGLAGRLPLRAVRPWQLAVLVLALVVAGTRLVHHDFAFTMDEFMTRFQAEIFESGRIAGRFPAEWGAYGSALMPVYSYFDPETGLVASSYRPGTAILYAIFDLVGLGPYLGAFLAAGSVVLVAAVARLIWPDREEPAIVAALLLATSQQTLAMSMTSFAMPAHLFFNLLWLWLFLRDTRPGHFVAPLVGVFTASLHQVHAHALFAVPFLLTLLRPLRPGLIGWYGAVYIAGHLLVLNWGAIAMGDASIARASSVRPDLGSASGFFTYLGRITDLPSLRDMGAVFVNLVRLFAWQSLALIPLLLMLSRRAAWSPILVLLSVSIVVSFAPYPLMVPDPQHGWGYRYLHGLIGNLALLGAAGWVALDGESARERTIYRAVVLVALIGTPLVMVPIRAAGIEAVVGAYARATEFVESRPADVVVVDPYTIFYGHDLRRNDPFLRNSPVVLTLDQIPKDRLNALCENYAVELVTGEDVARFGVPTFAAREASWTPESYFDWRRRLISPGCAPQ